MIFKDEKIEKAFSDEFVADVRKNLLISAIATVIIYISFAVLQIIKAISKNARDNILIIILFYSVSSILIISVVCLSRRYKRVALNASNICTTILTITMFELSILLNLTIA